MTDLAPPLLAADERFSALATLTDRLYQEDLSVLLVQHYDRVPQHLLPYLAEELDLLGTPAWRLADGDEAKQRALLASANELSRHLGTPWAIKQALRVQGAEAQLIEWWQRDPPAEPHTFELILDAGQGDNTQVRIDELIAEVRRVKPVRSHFIFTQTVSSTATVGVIAVARTLVYVDLVLQAPIAGAPTA